MKYTSFLAQQFIIKFIFKAKIKNDHEESDSACPANCILWPSINYCDICDTVRVLDYDHACKFSRMNGYVKTGDNVHGKCVARCPSNQYLLNINYPTKLQSVVDSGGLSIDLIPPSA